MSWFDSAVRGWYQSKIAADEAMQKGISSFGSSIDKAISNFGQNYQANKLGEQMYGPEMNSGAYAPRAAFVAPGVVPGSGDNAGSAQTAAGNVDTASGQVGPTPNAMPAPGISLAGTAPAKFTGGVQGLTMMNAIEGLKERRAALANTQLNQQNVLDERRDYHQNLLDTRNQTNQDRQDAINQRTQERITSNNFNKDTAAWDKTAIDSGKFDKQVSASYGKRAPDLFRQGEDSFQGDVVGNVFTPNKNGAFISNKVNGSADPDGVIIPMDQFNKLKDIRSEIDANGKYNPSGPRPDRATYESGTTGTADTGSGAQAITTQEQYQSLPSGARFTWNGRPGRKP